MKPTRPFVWSVGRLVGWSVGVQTVRGGIVVYKFIIGFLGHITFVLLNCVLVEIKKPTKANIDVLLLFLLGGGPGRLFSTKNKPAVRLSILFTSSFTFLSFCLLLTFLHLKQTKHDRLWHYIFLLRFCCLPHF